MVSERLHAVLRCYFNRLRIGRIVAELCADKIASARFVYACFLLRATGKPTSTRQISDYEACGLLDKRLHGFVRDDLMVQYRRVRQRLD